MRRSTVGVVVPLTQRVAGSDAGGEELGVDLDEVGPRVDRHGLLDPGIQTPASGGPHRPSRAPEAQLGHRLEGDDRRAATNYRLVGSRQGWNLEPGRRRRRRCR